MDPLDQPATAERLRRLAAGGLLSPAELELALARTGHLPAPRAWARFAGAALLLAGAALLLAGIFFFFAYNWADLHRFAKLALIQAAVLATGGYALWRGLARLDAQVALFAACALVGALLAVFGQIYQTGADSYTLFATWAALILLPTLLARNAPLWMLLVAVLHVALITVWEQRIGGRSELRDSAHFALAAALLIGWELARGRGAAWMRPPWYGRALLVVAAGWGLSLIFSAISQDWFLTGAEPGYVVAPLLALALGGAAIFYYRRVSPDLPALSLLALCAIVVVTVQVLNWVSWDNSLGILFLGGLVLAQVAAATVLLLREARAMGVAR